MADFRRWITALAVLALFAGLAAAQTPQTGNGQLVCNSVAQVTPTLRSEGVTELVGDIVITCTGGNYIAPGTQIPQANLIVSMSQQVTSRVVGGASEALLLIDEPNSGLASIVPGFGPAAPLTICTSTNGNCPEFAVQTTGTINGSSVPVVVASNTVGGTTPGYNVFQGTVSGNQITFAGIPILPPVTSGVQRVFRITNVRINASGAASQQVTAFLSFSGSSSVPVSNPTVTVGYVQPSLKTNVTNGSATTTVTNVNAFTQCNLNLGRLRDSVAGTANVALLQFSELFPSAFKTRVDPRFGPGNSSYLGTSSAVGYTQNAPGTLYNSESGLIIGVGSGNSAQTAGLADYGTRFQAVFSNIPSGAKLYVSRYNMATGFGVNSFQTTIGGATPGNAPANIGTLMPTAGAAQTPIASLTTTTTGGAFTNPTTGFGGVVTTAYGLVDVVPVTNNTAVWEVTNTNPSAIDSYTFAVYIEYTPNLANNQPTPSNNVTVTLSYNPIDANPGILPGNPNSIPRFINLSQPAPLTAIVTCQTVLLFPYVTSQGGFDTGIAISNTSLDPLGPVTTATSNGTCTLNFYGAGAPTTAPTVPSSTYPTVLTFGNGSATTPLANPTTIPAGGQVIFTTASVVPNFQGYMFATCNFQYAHGFAFVSDIGARNLAMGYLALIVNNGNPAPRAGNSQAYQGEALNQ